jgi:hypothetical protein
MKSIYFLVSNFSNEELECQGKGKVETLIL